MTAITTEQLSLLLKQAGRGMLTGFLVDQQVESVCRELQSRRAEVERLREAIRNAAGEMDLAALKTVDRHPLLSIGLQAAADRARATLPEDPE